MEESKTAIGSAIGTTVRDKYPKNLRINHVSTPFPAISSNANHKACITNTKSTIKNVAKKGCIKLFKMYLSNIFTRSNSVQKFRNLCTYWCQR